MDSSSSSSSRNDELVRVQNEMAVAMFRGGINFAKKHYVMTTLYIVGLLLFNFATGFVVTDAQRNVYSNVISAIDFRELEKAKLAMRDAYADYYEQKGWFTCNDVCTKLYARFQERERVVQSIEESHRELVTKARSHVGVFSEYAVSDARELFDDAFQRGKDFAKRQSYFDAFFMALNASRRDEGLLSIVLNWLLQAAINFSVGMVMALISFAIHVSSLIMSYNTAGSALSGFAFFFISVTAACAYVASFVVGFYLAAATSAFVVIKAVGPNFRIEAGRPGGPGARMLHVRQHQD